MDTVNHKFRNAMSLLVVLVLMSAGALAQGTSQTVVVLPFENESNAPGLQWISEAFSEVLGARMASPTLYVISREDRLYAFDRLGIPATVRPSRATLYRIAEQMDADYLVMGSYNFDGRTFSAKAQVLDMKRLHLSTELQGSGSLTDLISIQRGLAYDALRTIRSDVRMTKAEFLASAPPVRLDAFENYIRGTLATTRQEKVRYFKETLRLNPQYTAAIMQLGKTYFNNREYELAAASLARIPKSDSASSEANFLLGLSYFSLGQFEKSEAAFKVTESHLPLTEVYNNLGVVASRRGKRNAVEYFQKAVQADPHDADYHFNLGLALYRNGDAAGATRQLRDALSRRGTDSEAKQLLDAIASGAAPNLTRAQDPAATTAPKLPLERIKRNYDENSYRQVALEVGNAIEEALAKTDPRTHASFHVDHGRELLTQGFTAEAEKNFRESVMLDPASAGAHAGMARVAETNGDTATARNEAKTSIRLRPTAEAYLVLARLDLKENALDAAATEADQALFVEPDNAAAIAVKRSIAAKRAGVNLVPQQ